MRFSIATEAVASCEYHHMRQRTSFVREVTKATAAISSKCASITGAAGESPCWTYRPVNLHARVVARNEYIRKIGRWGDSAGD